MRKIVVDGQEYLWRFTPGYERAEKELSGWQCYDIFTAYLRTTKACPLQIHFRTWEDPISGGPLRNGTPVDLAKAADGQSGSNLHTPGWAAKLIRQARRQGWQPERGGKPYLIEQGLAFLTDLPSEL